MILVALIVVSALLATGTLGIAFACTGNVVTRHEWVSYEAIRRAPQAYERDVMRDLEWLPSSLARRIYFDGAMSALSAGYVTVIDPRTEDDIRVALDLSPRNA